MEDEEGIADQVKVSGNSRWTAEMFLMFNLLRPDVLPVADLGLQRAVSLHYCGGQFAGGELVRHVAEHWRPWRSVATWYLWRSLEAQPVLY
jgi:DNA-3-methyladenine glycosylase II